MIVAPTFLVATTASRKLDLRLTTTVRNIDSCADRLERLLGSAPAQGKHMMFRQNAESARTFPVFITFPRKDVARNSEKENTRPREGIDHIMECLYK
jgi:hypothetical protein